MRAMQRLAGPTDYSRWNRQFSKHVRALTAESVADSGNSTASVQERIALIRKLDPYVRQPCFTNTDEAEMVAAKEDLLNLWEYLLGFVVVMTKASVKDLGYQLIVQLMQREEFTLKRLGFGTESATPRCGRAHLELAERYKSLLLQTYMLVMKSMSTKGKFAEIIHFSAQTLVVFFFRLPLVGGSIIDALVKKADAQREGHDDDWLRLYRGATKWRKGTDDDSKSEGRDRSNSHFIMNNPDLFQWNYFNSEDEAKTLVRVLNSDNACLVWLSTKETFFLTFVEMYVMHVESVAHDDPVHWDSLPAYEVLLDCFWPLLRSAMWWDGICKRRVGEGDGWVTSLPAYMRVKRSALALLSNKILTNEFVSLTWMCCNAFSLLSVDSCVEHLNLWLSTVAYSSSALEGISNHNRNSRNTPPKQNLISDESHVKPSMPSNFDFENYWSGIKVLLESDQFQVVLKVLSLLYNTFHLFYGQRRIHMVNKLMNDRFFFSLFLHWSSEVRTYFQLTLVYRVFRADRRNLPCFTDAIVINDYGTPRRQESNSSVPIASRRLTFGEGTALRGVSAARAALTGDNIHVPATVYSGASSTERRMAAFDNTNSTDNEEMLIDMMVCSKIDSYIRMCMEDDESVPEYRRVYKEASLRQYASLLKQYYKGVMTDSSESLPVLAHRMVYSDSNPYV